MDPEYVESVWWAAEADPRQGPAGRGLPGGAVLPPLRTGLSDHEVAAGLRDGHRPQRLRPVPADLGAGGPGRPALLVWTTTPWTLVSNTAVAVRPTSTYVLATARHASGCRRRGAARRGARRGLRSAARLVPGRGDGALDLPAPVRAGGVPAGRRGRHRPAPRRARRTTSPPRTAPASCTSPPPSARTTWRPAGPTGCRSSYPSAQRALRRRHPAGRRPVLQARRRRPGPRPGRARPAVPARALRAQLPALLALPHRAMYYAQPSWYVRTTQIKDALLRENEETELVPRHDQARPLRRLAGEQHRLGALAQPLLGHPAADLALRAEGHQTCVGSLRAPRAHRHRPVRARPAPSLRRRRDLRLPRPRGTAARPRARGDRRLVRLRLDAVRAVGLPAREGSQESPTRYPADFICEAIDQTRGWFYTLMAIGDAGLRRVVVPERAVPRPHPGRGRPQDVQAPRQHPRADPADGRARRRRRALVHGRRRLAVGGAPGRARHHPGDRAQGPADLLEHRRLPGALRRQSRWSPATPAPDRGPAGARPLGAVRGAPPRARRDRGARAFDTQRPGRSCRRTSTTCRTGTSGARAAGSGTATPRRWRPCTSACTS